MGSEPAILRVTVEQADRPPSRTSKSEVSCTSARDAVARHAEGRPSVSPARRCRGPSARHDIASDGRPCPSAPRWPARYSSSVKRLNTSTYSLVRWRYHGPAPPRETTISRRVSSPYSRSAQFKKRDPVQQLEADLTHPRPDDRSVHRLLQPLELRLTISTVSADGMPSSSSLRSAGITSIADDGDRSHRLRKSRPGRLTASKPRRAMLLRIRARRVFAMRRPSRAP